MGKGKNDKKEFWEVAKRVEKILIVDNERKFVSTVKRCNVVCPYHLLKKICRHKAIKCGIAFIKGETGHTLDVNVPDETGAFPLHYAAHSWFPGLIDLLLHHGAIFDVRGPADHETFPGSLPLNVAMSTLSNVRWTPDQSIFQLIVIFCLPRWKRAMDTIRLLALSTEGTGMEMYRYAKEGKLIELAVLLMVAGEKVNTPFISPDENGSKLDGSMTVRQVLATEIKRLIYEKVKKGERNRWMSAWLLLEVFETAGDAINAYLQLEKTNLPTELVASEVAWLLQKAGFDLKYRDIDLSGMEWSPHKATREVGVALNMKAVVFKVVYPLMLKEKLQNEAEMACEVSKSKLMTMNYMPKQQRSFASPCFPHGSPAPGSTVQSFHTLPDCKASSGFELPSTAEAHSRKAVKCMQQCVPNYPSFKKWTFFALAIKRGIRLI